MTYEVVQFTLCDGWVNTWTVYDEHNQAMPETFAPEAEAQAAIDEFLAEISEEIETGQRDPDCGYDPSDFRVVMVGDP
jgi:hypothetical protein